MKKYLFGILAIAMAVGFSAFTTKKAHKPFTTYVMYYDLNLFQTRGPINPGTKVLDQLEVQDLNNWTTTFQQSATGAYLNGISFVQESSGIDVSDGIADGEYSRQEAVNELWKEYSKGTPAAYDLPTNGNTFTPSVSGASAITVERRAN